jgi:hypothetical protein
MPPPRNRLRDLDGGPGGALLAAPSAQIRCAFIVDSKARVSRLEYYEFLHS